MSYRANRITLIRDKNKEAIKAIQVFHQNIMPDINKLNRNIDKEIKSSSNVEFKNKDITPFLRLKYQSKYPKRFLQPISNIIMNINEWSIRITSKDASEDIISSALGTVLYDFSIQGMFVTERLKNRNDKDISGYIKLLKIYGFYD